MDTPQPSATCSPLDPFSCNSGVALNASGQTINNLLAAIAGSAASFGVQLLVFLLLRMKFKRIYRPRSYLVPEKERVPPPPSGLVSWLVPLFSTSNLTFIQKCGLDAYFFLRYLRMLLKIFVPIAIVILPILLPLNRYSGGTAAGLDKLSISNVADKYVRHRLWAHLVLAVGVIVWFCYVAYQELRGYIRVRQAFLTSPQHRIRASATTVLVTGIPRKWLTHEALAGLYDVFPGGIKNIWINRNFDSLAEKVNLRQSIANDLEAAETNLLKKCLAKHEKQVAKREKKVGVKKSKLELKAEQNANEAAAEQMAKSPGVTTGNMNEVQHGLQDVLNEAHEQEAKRREKERRRKATNLGIVGQGLDKVGLGVVNQGLGQGLGAVGHGLGALGRGVSTIGQKVVGDVDTGLHKTGDRINRTLDIADDGGNFVTDDELYRQSYITQDDGGISTPPSKSPLVKQGESEAGDNIPQLDGQPRPSAAKPSYTQHPLSQEAPLPDRGNQTAIDNAALERTFSPPETVITRPSGESRPKSSMQIELPPSHVAHSSPWKFWKNNDHSLALPSPQPHTADEDIFPLTASAVKYKEATRGDPDGPKTGEVSSSKWVEKLAFWRSGPEPEYPDAFNKDSDADQDGTPRWRRYIEPKDRETMHLPLLGFLPSLPLVGKKVDKIYHLRRELARLNLEIEIDQNNVENFEYMNSAFIQFNSQVAAHMACQSLSHHVPQHMAPRLLEIDPEDVVWDNMAIKWWERYLRTVIVLVICAALIVLYAIPVTFTAMLSKLSVLAATYSWLAWVTKIPKVVQSIIQGLMPAILLNLILLLTPMLFRALVRFQGLPTGAGVELGVQAWYFAFLFIQVFFVVTLSGGLAAFFTNLASNPGQVIKSLATSLPKGADYFFSYLLVQALGNSASALVQIASLLGWFVLAPLFDSTPRSKWKRETNLNQIQWGQFYPPFTNFAVIGIIYSVIAPFILIFMMIIFPLFWIVYRFNVLYVYQFRVDTGGLLFPVAVNQLFTGIYFLELCLIGFFFISTGPNGDVACIPQGVIMIVVLIFTAAYQWQLNSSFKPLFEYLPITLDDEAVIRDEEFARAQASKFTPLREDVDHDGRDDEEEDIQDVLKRREQREEAADEAAEERQRRDIAERRQSGMIKPLESTLKEAQMDEKSADVVSESVSDKKPTWKTDRWRYAAPEAVHRLKHLREGSRAEDNLDGTAISTANNRDLEAQQKPKLTQGDLLYQGYADELEGKSLSEQDREWKTRANLPIHRLESKRSRYSGPDSVQTQRFAGPETCDLG
jgi:calcium permeable stress-gated cation channel